MMRFATAAEALMVLWMATRGGYCSPPRTYDSCLMQQKAVLGKGTSDISEAWTSGDDEDKSAEVGIPTSLASLEQYVHEHLVSEDESVLLQAIPVIRLFLESLLNETFRGHDVDQGELDATMRLISECGPDVVTLGKQLKHAKEVHSDCRSLEVLNATEEKALCDVYDAQRKAPPSCSLLKATTSEPDELRMFEDCLREFSKWWAIYDHYMACFEAREVRGRQREQCLRDQAAFESAACGHALGQDVHCSCRTKHISFYWRIHADVLRKEADRKADFEAAKRIDCLVDVAEAAGNGTGVNKSSILQACMERRFNSSGLDIQYASIPDELVDCSPLSVPCKTSWLQAEYAGESWHDQLSLGPCQACKVPTTSTTTTRTTTTAPPGPLAAVSGCPSDGSSCELWQSDADKANSNGYSPNVVTLPRSQRTGNRWWTGSCSGGSCDMWMVVKLSLPSAVSLVNFLNYQDQYGAKDLRVSASSNLEGPFGDPRVFSDLKSSGAAKWSGRGTIQNHCCTVPDEDLIFDPPLVGQFFKFEILKNHGSGGSGFYRVYFTGSHVQAA